MSHCGKPLRRGNHPALGAAVGKLHNIEVKLQAYDLEESRDARENCLATKIARDSAEPSNPGIRASMNRDALIDAIAPRLPSDTRQHMDIMSAGGQSRCDTCNVGTHAAPSGLRRVFSRKK